jgi:hypothetical protein
MALGMEITPKRYFYLDHPISEGFEKRTHPWVLDFGFTQMLQSVDVPTLKLLPSEPSAQLSLGYEIPQEQFILVSLSLGVIPSDEEVEIIDFAGALVSLVTTEGGPKLCFVSKDTISGEFEWFEAAHELSIEGPVVNLDFSIFIDRLNRKWTFQIGDSIYENLDLMSDSELPFNVTQGFYVLGNTRSELFINNINIKTRSIEVEDRVLSHSDLVRQIFKSFFKASSAKLKKDPVTIPIIRRRLVVLDYEFFFLDESGSKMPKIELDDGRKLTIYSSGGPQPTEIELTAEIEADLMSDLEFVHWILLESDWEGTRYSFLDSGSFKDGLKVYIPMIPDEKGNFHITYSIRVYLDHKGSLSSLKGDSP